MSYRNPQQYIDTQSMQIQQNLQKTLSGVGTKLVSDVNKIHEENAKKVEEIRAAADARVEKAQNSIIQTQSKNPTADFGDLQPQFNTMNAILLKDPTKRTAKEKSFVTSMSSIGDTMANSLKNTAMAQEAMLEQVDKIPGTPGAIAADEDPELYAKLSVLANRTPGRTVAKYKTNENGQVVFSMDVYGEINGKEKFLGNIINDNVSTTQMPGIIPDITKDMSSSIKQTINSEDFTSKFGAFINEQGAMVYTKDGKSKGAKVTEEYFKTQLEPNAKNILLGLTPREKTRLYNNTLDKGDKADFDYNESWSDDKQKLIEEALMNSLIRETKETYPIFAKTVDLTEKQGDEKTTKLTEAGKKFNDKVSLGKEVLNEIKSLTDNKKQKGSKNFSLDKLGAFIDVINSKRKGSDPKIVRTEDLKALYLRQDGNTEESWEDVRPKTDLAYRTSSGAIIPVDISDPKKLNNSMLDLLIPGIKPSERDSLLKAIIGGNQDRPKLP